MLMAKGHIVYAGAPLDALEYFNNISPLYQCPKLTNPAEFLLDIITGESILFGFEQQR
jgi:hypothetical protein